MHTQREGRNEVGGEREASHLFRRAPSSGSTCTASISIATPHYNLCNDDCNNDDCGRDNYEEDYDRDGYDDHSDVLVIEGCSIRGGGGGGGTGGSGVRV